MEGSGTSVQPADTGSNGEHPFSDHPLPEYRKAAAKIDSRLASELTTVVSWTREEVATPIELAEQHESRFAPLLFFLLSTGCRRVEARGLKWQDVNPRDEQIDNRRSFVQGSLGTPKSTK